MSHTFICQVHRLDPTSRTFDVNVLAHFWILKAFLPRILEQKIGHIVCLYVLTWLAASFIFELQVTISSVTAFSGMVRMADYCASKSALIGLHESLRYELDKV